MTIMGWCHEFGMTVGEGCGHPMAAGETSCQCEVCGFVCPGQFAGCSTVWANGPREVNLVRPGQSALGGRATYLPSLDVVGETGDATPPEPNRDSELQSPAGTRPSSTPTTAGPVPVAAADEMRGQVFEWLHDSFDGLRSQLRTLSDAVSRQQGALDSMPEAGAAAERLARLADVLPDRIGDAVHEAITSRGVELDAAGEADANAELDLAGPIRSFAGDLGSTHVHHSPPPINRDGWQEKLRALRSVGSQSGG